MYAMLVAFALSSQVRSCEHCPIPRTAEAQVGTVAVVPTTTAEDFADRVAAIEASDGYQRPAAFAVGVATVAPSGKVLDTSYPVVNLEENFAAAAVIAAAVGHAKGTATYLLDAAALDAILVEFVPFEGDGQPHPNVDALKLARRTLDAPVAAGGTRVVVVAFIGALTDVPTDASDVYLRLHLLSHRKVQPNGVSLEGAFGLLTNVVWTNLGPFDPDGFDLVRASLRAEGAEVRVHALDKFPRMTDYVIPSGVRIADADRVRLGAHLASGTTVMHEGHVNHNAGTLGTSMVEGRITAGVVVGDGSDIGGGASIMGTLSEVARSRSASVRCASWERTPESASRSATTASSRPAATSRRARR